MGRIVHPVRMRPGKPLPLASSVTPSTSEKKDEKKKRKREKPKLVRARRRTIDPTKWDSQHLKGAFLDSIVVADQGDNFPVATSSRPNAADDREEVDLSSDEEDEGDESHPSEPDPVVEGSSTAPALAQMQCDTVDTDHDFNQEKLHALSLLDSMFGGLEGDQEWGGKEALDSDVPMPELSPVQTPPSPQPSSSKEVFKGPDLKPAVKEAQTDSESEESSTDAHTPAPERPPASTIVQNANTTKTKLKDLFAPQEEQGTPPPTNHLSQV